MGNILCFGDSITYGAWDPAGGYVARLRRAFEDLATSHDLYPPLVYNLGISADTSLSLRNRISANIAAWNSAERADVIIIAIGTNDAIRDVSTGQLWVPPSDYVANLTQIVAIASTHVPHVYLLGHLPVNEAKTRPYTWDPTIEQHNTDLAHYEHLSAQVAKVTPATHIPIFDKSASGDYVSLLADDGVHPNSAGHTSLATATANALSTLPQYAYLTPPPVI